MPNKRKTVQEREQELAQRIMNDVNAGMDARFARFEHLFDRLAPPAQSPQPRQLPPAEPAVTRSKKRAADQVSQEEAESPKASKSAKSGRHNDNFHTTSRDIPEPTLPRPARTPNSTARQSAQATPRHPSADFAEQPRFAEQPGFAEHTSIPTTCKQPGQPWRSTTPHLTCHQAEPPLYARPQAETGTSDTWTAWSTAHEGRDAYFRRAPLPTSTHDLSYDAAVDSQVRQLLANSVHNLGKGNSPPYDFPYKYILRGPEKIKATINSVTLPEHLWGIFRMIHDPKTNPDVKPCLMVHVEQIVEDAREYDWDLGVRRWSEEVFSRISEGRLLKGWQSIDEIQRMRMILAQSKPILARSVPYVQNQQRDNFTKRQPAQTQSQTEILKGGPPCPDYNSATGCTLRSGHIKDGKRLVHVCAFCLLNTSAANTHPEVYCRNKIRLTGAPHHF